MLIACRIVLGAGEGPAAPVATHAIYKWFPDSLRGVPTGVVAGLIGAVIIFATLDTDWHAATGNPFSGSTAVLVGQALLDPFVLPFEVASVLLVVAMVGAIILVRPGEAEA